MADQKQQENIKTTYSKGKKRYYFETESHRVFWLDDLSKTKRSIVELVAEIVNKIEAEPFYHKHINKIYYHMQKIMTFFYGKQNVKIWLFGSSVTKLALRDSDVDIYLDFGGTLPETPEKLLKTLKNRIRKYGYFIKVIPIFARVPIVRCIHQSKISCDISFLNTLGVCNSRLIGFLVSLDRRIRPLILIIKFIMKNHGLLEQNAFTSFGFTILTLFFLQALENPLIPSISYLQNLAGDRKIVEDWDTSFATDIGALPAVNNELSVVELLQKFFEYYSTFEFGFYVISFFTGKSYLKQVFSNPDLIPQEFYFYKKNLEKNENNKLYYNKVLCVQGPFNHCCNITRNVGQKSLIQFQHLCWVNATLGKELLYENLTEENIKKYLVNILDQNDKESSNYKKLKNKSVVIFVGEDLAFDDDCNCTEDSLRNKWAKYVFNIVKDILFRVMKCDIDVQSINAENNSDDFDGNEKLIKCEMHYYELVSKKRKEVRSEFDFPQNMNVIDTEEIISNYLCDKLLKSEKKTSLKFDIICSVKKSPTCFCMDLCSKESQKSNHFVQQMFNFIQNNFPKWIK